MMAKIEAKHEMVRKAICISVSNVIIRGEIEDYEMRRGECREENEEENNSISVD